MIKNPLPIQVETDINKRIVNYFGAIKVYEMKSKVEKIHDLLSFLALNNDNCIIHVRNLTEELKTVFDEIPIYLDVLMNEINNGKIAVKSV